MNRQMNDSLDSVVRGCVSSIRNRASRVRRGAQFFRRSVATGLCRRVIASGFRPRNFRGSRRESDAHYFELMSFPSASLSFEVVQKNTFIQVQEHDEENPREHAGASGTDEGVL